MFRRPRQHNEAHLAFVRGLPCAGCRNNIQTEAAHIRMGAPHLGKRKTGLGEKASDIWVIPLCSQCHRDQHVVGERAWWNNCAKRDPHVLALALWAHTGQHEVGEQIVRAAHD